MYLCFFEQPSPDIVIKLLEQIHSIYVTNDNTYKYISISNNNKQNKSCVIKLLKISGPGQGNTIRYFNNT